MAADNDENAQCSFACPACPKIVSSTAALNKHLDSECTSVASQPSRSKTPTPSQRTKKPKTPSRSNSKMPKKTAMAETTGNGNLNSFFKKAETQKPPSSLPPPAASQGKRKKEKSAAAPSSSLPVPPSSLALDDEEYQRALDESRAMHEYEKARRLFNEDGQLPESSLQDVEAEIREQRQRWEAEQPGHRAALAAHTRILEEAELRRTEVERVERKQQQEAENECMRIAEQAEAEAHIKTKAEAKAAKGETKAKEKEKEAQRARRWEEAEKEGRRIAEEAEAQAKAKADAKAAKAETKAHAKAEKARLKTEAAAAADVSDPPCATQIVPIKETPIQPPSSQKLKRGKSVPPPSSAPLPASEKGSDSEINAQPAPSQKKRKRGKSAAPSSTAPPAGSQKDSDTESTGPPPPSQKRKRGKSPAPTSTAPRSPSQNDSESDALVPPPGSQKQKRGKSVQPSSNADVAPHRSQNDSASEGHAAPEPSQSKKRKRKSKSKSEQPANDTALFPSQAGSGSDTSAQSPISNPSPSGSQTCQLKETRILFPPSVLRSRSKPVSPSSDPAAPTTQSNAQEEQSNEPPASTPTPTASQIKKAKKRQAKKDKKATILEKSSTHSRDGQEQSNVVNPIVAPFTMNPRKKAAGLSRLSSAQSIDSSQGGQDQAPPMQSPRRGSLVPTYDGRVAPVEKKLTSEQIEWANQENAYYDENELEREQEAAWMRGEFEMDAVENDEMRESRERAEHQERERQQEEDEEEEEEEERERAHQEEDARVQAVWDKRLRVAEEERMKDEAHNALMAEGTARLKAQNEEAKAKRDARNMAAEVERDELQCQNEDDCQRQERDPAESKARAKQEERQRRLDKEEERLHIEAEAEADVEAEVKAEAEALRIAELARTEVADTDDEDANDHEMYNESEAYHEVYEEMERPASQKEMSPEDLEIFEQMLLPASQKSTADNDDDTAIFEQQGSPEPAHGYVDEQDIQIKLPQPTTMDKLQQKGFSFSTSSPYSSAPWSSAPKSQESEPTQPQPTQLASPKSAIGLGPAPSQDYDSYFDNSHMEDSFQIEAEPPKDDSQGSTDILIVEDDSQEYAELWEDMPDEPAPTAPILTPVHRYSHLSAAVQRRLANAAEMRADRAMHYNIPARPATTPFRAPMTPSAYTKPKSPTSSQKHRRAEAGWMPSDPVQPNPKKPTTYDAIPSKAPRNSPQRGILQNIGPFLLDTKNHSPKSRRIAFSKEVAKMRRAFRERVAREEELDLHMMLRWRQKRADWIMNDIVEAGNEMRFNLLKRMEGWTSEQVMRYLDNMPVRRPEDEPAERTIKQLHDLEAGWLKIDEEGQPLEDKDKPILYALRESILDSNVGSASLYLAKMLKMRTEPRRITEVLCATAARCVPDNLVGDKPFSGNPMSGHYAGLASDTMNIVAFSDSSDELVQEQLLACTVQLAQANKTNKWKSGLKELMDALEGDGELEIPAMLQEGTEEDKKRKDMRDKAPSGFVDDSSTQGTVERKMKTYFPPAMAHLFSFMREVAVPQQPERPVEEDYEMEEYIAATP